MQLQWLEPAANGADLDASELGKVGVVYRRIDGGPGAYQPVLDELMGERGYSTQDEVELRPDTPNLDEICDKFAPEHLHTDDEVRFVLEGEGIFDIRSADDRWMRVTVEAGDLIVVPANLHHRFFLTDKRMIRCARLFKNESGWVAHYRSQAEAQQ